MTPLQRARRAMERASQQQQAALGQPRRLVMRPSGGSSSITAAAQQLPQPSIRTSTAPEVRPATAPDVRPATTPSVEDDTARTPLQRARLAMELAQKQQQAALAQPRRLCITRHMPASSIRTAQAPSTAQPVAAATIMDH